MMSRLAINQIWVPVLLMFGLAISSSSMAEALSDEAQECVDYHIKKAPAMVADWQRSAHAENVAKLRDW